MRKVEFSGDFNKAIEAKATFLERSGGNYCQMDGPFGRFSVSRVSDGNLGRLSRIYFFNKKKYYIYQK